MITSGTNIEKISEKIAALRTEIKQAGLLGLLNINKHCENFVMGLLNLTYGYKLENLNKHIVNFPGLDLGATGEIAFQVTSENGSNKVNDTLDKVIRYNHYLTFPKIKMFILSDKQGTYTISTTTEPLFSFDWKTDIISFDDVLKAIQQLDATKLNAVYEYINNELPDTITALTEKEKIVEAKTLINIENSLSITGLKNYEHFRFTVRLRGGNYSTPTIYQKLTELQQYHDFKHALTIFNIVFRQNDKITSKQMEYREHLEKRGVFLNTNVERVLQINDNMITYELARYTSEDLMLTHLMHEMHVSIMLLFACKYIYKPSKLQLEVDIDLSTNCKLCFHPMNTIYQTIHSQSTYHLEPSPKSYSRVVHDTDNATLVELMQELIYGFVTKENFFGTTMPYIQIDTERQNKVLDILRANLNLTPQINVN